MFSSFGRPNGNSYYPQGAGMQMPCSGCGSKPLSQIPLPTGEMPALPSGVPTGPSPVPVTAVMPSGQMQSGAPSTGGQPPLTSMNTMFTPGFLSTQIGKTMRVEFLIGTNGPLVDRVGTLIGVGTSYILLRPTESDDILLCDMYSIKFVTILL